MATDNQNQPDEEAQPDDNAPWHPEAPKERETAEVDEINAISSSVAILEEFFADLDADIEELRGVDIIDGVNPATDPTHLLIAVQVNQNTRFRMIKLRKKYERKYKPHIKRDADVE